MDKIILKNTLHHTTTILPNEFIDHYMIKADGEYVKIYLLILRLMNQNLPVQIDQLADTLELTQKDIIRALKYWEKEGLLELEDSSAAKAQNEQPAGQEMLAGQQAGQTAGGARIWSRLCIWQRRIWGGRCLRLSSTVSAISMIPFIFPRICWSISSSTVSAAEKRVCAIWKA